MQKYVGQKVDGLTVQTLDNQPQPFHDLTLSPDLGGAGGKPIVLMGGGTTKVGDPSGKDEARKVLSDSEISSNIKSFQKTFEKFVRVGTSKTDALIVNNAEWLDHLNYIHFLRDVGRHFSVNRMLTQDSVKLRLEREQEMSFIEFNYMVCQAYDFVELSRRVNCRLQMGGSDQWGNISLGVDLIRRKTGQRAHALTWPLLLQRDGSDIFLIRR